MKLSRVLFPEIILDRRGDSNQRNLVKHISSLVFYTQDGLGIELPENLSHLYKDTTLVQHFCLARRFKDDKAPTFHLCTDFAKALLDLDDREIPIEFLADFFGYISFPSDLVTDGDDLIDGALVYIGMADRKTALHKNLWGKRILWLSYVCAATDRPYPPIGSVLMELKKDTVENNIAELQTHHNYWSSIQDFGNKMQTSTLDPLISENQTQLVKLIINTVLYLSSQDPVLLNLKPTFGKTKTQGKVASVGGHTNGCTIPITAINWDYKQERVWYVDSSFVNSHPRWQRCGEGLSQIKLIWVKEHTRNYKAQEVQP